MPADTNWSGDVLEDGLFLRWILAGAIHVERLSKGTFVQQLRLMK